MSTVNISPRNWERLYVTFKLAMRDLRAESVKLDDAIARMKTQGVDMESIFNNEYNEAALAIQGNLKSIANVINTGCSHINEKIEYAIKMNQNNQAFIDLKSLTHATNDQLEARAKQIKK